MLSFDLAKGGCMFENTNLYSWYEESLSGGTMQVKARAAEPPTCKASPWSSRVCELGTKSCDVRHSKGGSVKYSRWIGLIIACLLLSACATIQEANKKGTWTHADTTVLVVGTIVSAMDWSQTLHIADYPNDHREMNTLMGGNGHPSRGQVNTYFALNLFVLQPIVLYFCPPNWRRYIIGGNAAVEGTMVLHNLGKGIHPF